MRDINWDYVGDSVPAFLTIIIIPLTYKYVAPMLWCVPCVLIFTASIAYGVIAGIMSYIIINGVPFVLKRASGGRIIPTNNYAAAEEWNIPAGSLMPGWMQVPLPLFVMLHTELLDDRLKLRGRSPSSESDASEFDDIGGQVIQVIDSQSPAESEKVHVNMKN